MAKDSKTKTKAKSKRKKKVHPNSLKNLKLFEKGKSGNLKGAPKGKHLSTILEKLIEKRVKLKNHFTGKKEIKTIADWICIELIVTALFGEKTKGKALSMIFDRLEGKVEEKVNMKIDESASTEAIKEKMYAFHKRNNVNEEEE